MSTQRVYVTTKKVEGGYPYFRVDAHASDKFIAAEIKRRYGLHNDGKPHDWQAFDETDVESPPEGVESN